MGRDLEGLLAGLTIEQKAALTAGADMWRTTAVPDAGIPALKVSDGPVGARGDLTSGATSTCFPCGAALGATWDVELAEAEGAALAAEARSKGARVLLAPTVNLHRHPLAGRNFECFAEEPELTARIASAYVRGLQAGGVGACIKHYVANDQEHERMTISSEVDERTLRELYLRPFEAAVAEADPWSVMAAYNKINGTYASEHRRLLVEVLKDEWGWSGAVISDWFATHDTVASATGGLDLQMPGPPAQLGPKLAEAVRAGEVPQAALDDMARRMLHLIDRAGLFDDPDEPAERSDDAPERREVARAVSTGSIVLLRNDGALPLDASSLRRVAVIGPGAHPGFEQGGGSALVHSHRHVSPLDGIRAALPDAEVTWARGCALGGHVPPIHPGLLAGGGWKAKVWTNAEGDGDPVHEDVWSEARYSFFGGRKMPGVLQHAPLRIELTATLTPDQSGPWQLHLVCAGKAEVAVDGRVVAANPEPGPFFAVLPQALATDDATVELEAGRAVDLTVVLEVASRRCFPHLYVGATPPDPGAEMRAAAELAGAAEVAILVVGTGPEIETEGIDRTSMAMPAGQDDLVAAVLAAQPNTVVVVGAGAPVAMPWVGDVRAVLWSWFHGQEGGHAIADVLVGTADPGGRLPTTLPKRLDDTPAFATYPGADGIVRYDEGLLIGHRWYDAKGIEPAFPFGHGGSYTTFALGTPTATVADDGSVAVTVPVRNKGDRDGVEVVQAYVAAEAGAAGGTPIRQLAGFAKVAVAAGATVDATVHIQPRALAHWDTDGWRVPAGTRTLHIGRSSADLTHQVVVTLTPATLRTPQP